MKDSQGNPTGHTRCYATNSGYKLWEFYQRFSGKPRGKKGKKKASRTDILPKKEEAEKILKNMYEYANEKREKEENKAEQKEESK